MKTLIICISVLLIGSLIFTCNKQVEEISLEPTVIQLNEKGKMLIESSGNFGIDLFKKVIESETDSANLMISPFSVSMALAMTYNGAYGETKTAMENALRLNNLSIDEININFKQISEALVSVDNHVNITIANSIWYRNNFSVLPSFIQANIDFYDAQVSALDFNDPETNDIINDWVSDKTNGKITEIVDQIDPLTVMFLINAIYFKGPWKYEFNEEDNTFRTFYLSNGSTKQVEMMTQKTDLAYFKNEMFSLVELPYGQGNWAMDLILPKQGKTIDDVTNEMSGTAWNTWITSLGKPSALEITLPPFRFAYNKELNDALSAMGMAVSFNPAEADFSKINKIYQLYISKVQHKTFIEVNEEGTEAAAVTSVEMGYTSIDDNALVFDRPFLFVIREVSTGTILFIGRVEYPVR